MLSVRPKVAELSFQLFGRALHPELFEVHKTRTVERGEFTARLDITTAGHVITWRYRGLTLTEVAASAQHPLPERRRPLPPRYEGGRFAPSQGSVSVPSALKRAQARRLSYARGGNHSQNRLRTNSTTCRA